MGKHSEWRKLAKKSRRKRIRQKLAQDRDNAEAEEAKRRKQSPTYRRWLQGQNQIEEYQRQEERRLAAEANDKWLQAEKEAQKHWLELQEKLEFAREERAKQNALIKVEWERESERLKAIEEAKLREAEEKQHLQEMINQQIEDYVENGGDMPEELKKTLETNPNKPICPFFKKTGACRFSDTCSRNHVRPSTSRIILIPNFYTHISLEHAESEYGTDSLEYETHETYNHFKEFFHDVLPEFERHGEIKQFKVCCNKEQHLRGNVYVEYSNCREAIKSYRVFQGRWYGGKQLNVEFCKVDSWKSAICGLYFRKTCPKGTACNFLHVFRNPGNLFNYADKDSHRSHTNDLNSEFSSARNWRWSESPERIPLQNGKNYEQVDSKWSENWDGSKSDKHTSRSRKKRSRSKSRKRKHRSESSRTSHGTSSLEKSKRSRSRSHRSRSKSKR